MPVFAKSIMWFIATVAIFVAGGLSLEFRRVTAQERQQTTSLNDDSGPQVGTIAPAFTLPDVHGQMHSLSSFRGHPVVLAFFCGCDRCHAAALKIAAQQRQGKLRSFLAVVALDPASAGAFQRATGLQGTVLIDPSDAISGKYDSEFCPRLWGISSGGQIAFRSNDSLEGADLSSAVDKAVLFGS